MRTLVLLGWLMVPVVFGAYHYGPGQERLRLDDAAGVLAEADRLAAAEQWQAAVTRYDEAQALLPEGRVDDVRRIRLKRAKVQMFAHQLPEANAALAGTGRPVAGRQDGQPGASRRGPRGSGQRPVLHDVAHAARGAERRRMGARDRDARQTYRLLAEQAEAAGDPQSARRHREDLESAIRLARLEVGELQGLAIPSQCQGCKSGQCKKPGKRAGKKPEQGRREERRSQCRRWSPAR